MFIYIFAYLLKLYIRIVLDDTFCLFSESFYSNGCGGGRGYGLTTFTYIFAYLLKLYISVLLDDTFCLFSESFYCLVIPPMVVGEGGGRAS